MSVSDRQQYVPLYASGTPPPRVPETLHPPVQMHLRDGVTLTGQTYISTKKWYKIPLHEGVKDLGIVVREEWDVLRNIELSWGLVAEAFRGCK
jgi:hypothetical protein